MGVLALDLAWEWLRPTGLPEAQRIVPPEMPIAVDTVKPALDSLLKSNIFNEARGPVETGEPAEEVAEVEVQQEAVPGEFSEWRLVGVAREGIRSFAVVATQPGDKTKIYRTGDQLPGGEILVDILPFGVQVEQMGEYESRYLFGKE